jgi:hypothetical protein
MRPTMASVMFQPAVITIAPRGAPSIAISTESGATLSSGDAYTDSTARSQPDVTNVTDAEAPSTHANVRRRSPSTNVSGTAQPSRSAFDWYRPPTSIDQTGTPSADSARRCASASSCASTASPLQGGTGCVAPHSSQASQAAPQIWRAFIGILRRHGARSSPATRS